MNRKQEYDKLVTQFAEAADRSFEAALRGDWKENNKWVRKQVKAFQRIIELGDAARDELLTLLDHENLAIAKSAAAFSLKYATERSKATLMRIAQEPGVLGFEAKQAMLRWEEGNWQLE